MVELAQLLVGYFQKKDYDLTKLQGSINYDYFNKMLAKGKEKGDMVATAKALIEATAMLPKYRVLNVNALTLNNAGAYIYQELGYALAWGKEYMTQMTDAGMPEDLEAAYDAILETVQNGTISEERLDNSVNKILYYKQQFCGN